MKIERARESVSEIQCKFTDLHEIWIIYGNECLKFANPLIHSGKSCTKHNTKRTSYKWDFIYFARIADDDGNDKNVKVAGFDQSFW